MTPWARTALILSWALTFIAFLWLGSVTLSLVWSNRPAPGAANQQRRHASEPKTGQHEPEASPYALGAQSAASEINSSPDRGAQRADDKSAEWGAVIVAVLALGVAIWQLCYFGSQLRFMRHELKGSARAAIIAERSATAAETTMLQAERAFIQVVGITSNENPLIPNAILSAPIKNYGRTAALEVRGMITVMRGPDLQDKSHLPPIILAANSAAEFTSKSLTEMGEPKERIDNVNAGKISMLIWVVVEYRDVFKNKHTLVTEAVYNRNPPHVTINASYET